MSTGMINEVRGISNDRFHTRVHPFENLIASGLGAGVAAMTDAELAPRDFAKEG
jgi:hypothetical protein